MRLLAVIVSALVIAGCDSNTGPALGSVAKLAAGVESDFTILVSGTPGTKFIGGYMLMQADGSNTHKSVEGKTPSEYKMRGTMISTSFQKQSTKGELVVTVHRDGKEVSQSDTTAAYGVVSVATQ